MNIQTSRFGDIQYSEKDIITFPKGIPGLEEYTQFVIVPADEKQETPFFFLQSIQEGDLCLFLLDTLQFFTAYEVKLDEQTISLLDIEQPQDVLICTIVTVKDQLQQATTNQKAPLVINHRTKQATQMVLDKDEYLIKQPLFVQEDKQSAVSQ